MPIFLRMIRGQVPNGLAFQGMPTRTKPISLRPEPQGGSAKFDPGHILRSLDDGLEELGIVDRGLVIDKMQ